MYNLYFIIYISTVILGIGCYIKDRNLMSWISIPFFSSGKKNKTKKKLEMKREKKFPKCILPWEQYILQNFVCTIYIKKKLNYDNDSIWILCNILLSTV